MCRSAGLMLMLLFWLGSGVATYAQPVAGVRSLSLGRATTALEGNPWAVFANPAMLEADHTELAFLGIRNYELSDLDDMAAAFTFPFQSFGIGLGGHRYGNDLYRENRLSAALTYRYERLRAGAAIHYLTIAIEGYGSAGTVGLDLGVAAQPAEGIWIAAHATNLNRPEIGQAHEPLPRQLSIGISGSLSKRLLWTGEVVKDVRFPLAFRSGLEAGPFLNLKLRAGMGTDPETVSGGLAYDAAHWSVAVAAERHQVLGYTPGIELTIRW